MKTWMDVCFMRDIIKNKSGLMCNKTFRLKSAQKDDEICAILGIEF